MTLKSGFTKEGGAAVLIDTEPSPGAEPIQIEPGTRPGVDVLERLGRVLMTHSRLGLRAGSEAIASSVANFPLTCFPVWSGPVLGDGGEVVCADGAPCVTMTVTDAVLEDSGTLRRPGEAS